MTLFGLNISRATSAPAATKSGDETPISQLSPEALAWLAGSSSPDSRASALVSPYEQVVWVYRAINIMAEQIANIPFLLSTGERGRENLVTSGPLMDFYARPHPQINRFQYWELRVIWLMLRGECFRIPIYSDTLSSTLSPTSSSPAAPKSHAGGFSTHGTHGAHGTRHLSRVLILDPACFQHIVQDNQLLGWRYTGFGPQTPLESQVFLPEEVWFEKLPNPFDFWRGMSPLYVASTAAKADFAAANFMRGLMENNGDLGLIVRTQAQLDPQQREQVLAELRKRKRRAGVADQPLLLSDSVEIVKPQLSSADLQFLENRRFSRSEICAAFGVPEEIVSTTANSQYDVMAGARQNFIENRIAPLCSRLEAEENVTTIPAILGSTLNSQLSTLNSPVTGWFDLDSLPIMQTARRNRLATAKTGFDMGIPFNELNRVFDLGFKPLPWGDRGYLPTKYQPLPQGSAGVPPASARAVPALASSTLSSSSSSSFSQSALPNSKPKTEN